MRTSYLIGITVFLLLLLGSFSNSLVGYSPNGQTLPQRQTDSRAIIAHTVHAPISITSDMDFETQGWPGNGTLDDPYIISGLNITSPDVCIDIRNTRAHFRVMNCIISSPPNSNYEGLYLDNVTNGVVRDCIIDSHVEGFFLRDTEDCILVNNTASNNLQVGFVVFTSDNCTITNNTATNNVNIGFLLNEADNSTLTNNTATDTYYGFRFYLAENCILINNTAMDNQQWGFRFETYANNSTLTNNTAINSNSGFSLDNTDNCTLTDNIAKDNAYAGFYLGHADNCTLLDNTATNNARGFRLYFSSGNSLYGNTMIFNSENAEDEGGFNNTWDDEVSSGNYWDDYDCSGVYTITGSSGSVDRFPFLWDIVIPSIDNPDDVSYVEGTTGHLITWNPFDLHANRFELYRNSSFFDSGDWDGSSIIVNVDALAVGIYNYTLIVYDCSGNNNSDTVFVNVVDSTAPSINNPTDLEYEEGSLGHNIIWNVSDLHPERYELFKDGLLIDSGDWDGSPIIVNVDSLSVGVYNYTLVVYDAFNNSNSDTLLVTVTSPATTTSATTTTTTTATGTHPTTSQTGTEQGLSPQTVMLIAGGCAAVLAIVILAYVKRR